MTGGTIGNGIDSAFNDGDSIQNPGVNIDEPGVDPDKHWRVLGVGTTDEEALAHASVNQVQSHYVRSRGVLSDFVRTTLETVQTNKLSVG